MPGHVGYASPAYAESLSEFGSPRRLPACGGSILTREVPGSVQRDAMGPYPLFACSDWSALGEDLAVLRGELVALSLVADPFGAFELSDLRRFFDRVAAYKDHFVVDLSKPMSEYVHRHHRRNAERALSALDVKVCADPPAALEEWCGLYVNLVRRHHIRGIAAFSRESFEKQLRVPGVMAVRATQGADVVGMTLWFVDGDVAYYHLGAYSDTGYRLGGSFALFWRALDHLTEWGVRWASLGAGAGVRASADDGLSRFKRGWATGTRAAYLCGSILDPDRYAELAAGGSEGGPVDYFPAYRAGEFAGASAVT